MHSLHRLNFLGSDSTRGDLRSNTFRLQGHRATKRLALCTGLTYYKPAKLLDRNLSTAGDDACDTPEVWCVRHIPVLLYNSCLQAKYTVTLLLCLLSKEK